ncbi:HEPN domain-containing protein [Indioceanicola profundi]|uniref:HEPN domain-containing protein n=1 Tax=Indioceanicola profundi TaxID=2220096 RepID=UPI0013C4E4B7|nr:HEPN domain-containing protein [Indioceanicola profundi]
MALTVEDLLAIGKRNLEAARYNIEGGFADIGLSRAYYAMFHGASAALLSIGITPRTHAGVRTMFAQNFVKPGHIAVGYFEMYSYAFALRQDADYSGRQLSLEEVQPHLENAAAFIAEVRRFLSLPGD